MSTKHDIRIYPVVISNELARRYIGPLLSPTQLKFIRLCIACISRENLDDTYFKTSDFVRVMGIKTAKDKVVGELKQLSNAIFRVKDDADAMEYKWFSCVEESSGELHAKLDESVEKFVLYQQAKFTQYTCGFICRLGGKYSIPLYEFFRSWLGIGRCSMTLADMKVFLQYPYDRVTDVENRVIIPAINEINGKTDINVRFERSKGKGFYSEREKCTGYNFKISAKDSDTLLMLLKNQGIHDDQISCYDSSQKLSKAEKKERFLAARKPADAPQVTENIAETESAANAFDSILDKVLNDDPLPF